MADQKSRGGQKQEFVGEGGGKNRDVHPQDNTDQKGRSMKEDAARGKQGEHGGYDQHLQEEGPQPQRGE